VPPKSASVLSGILQAVSEVGAMPERALRVLQAAIADAGGQPGVHVSRARVMQQAGISELEEFSQIVDYLAGQGFIAEGVNDYDLFSVTLRGIAAGTR
jgi:hypothetical protein